MIAAIVFGAVAAIGAALVVRRKQRQGLVFTILSSDRPHKPSLAEENLANSHPISHLSYLSKLTENSLKELSKPVSLNTYLITIPITLSSQPTFKGIPLKLLYSLSMTTSSEL